MRFTLIAVGQKMPDWVTEGVAEYQKRLPREFSLTVREIPLSPRNKNADLNRAIEREGEHMLAAIPKGDTVVALDVTGRPWSTESLAQQCERWNQESGQVSLLVGGPDGLAPACVQRADRLWSLSDLTLPHPLVRVILAEQLYRAWSLMNNHPYHRA